jgi:hypothetical protein
MKTQSKLKICALTILLVCAHAHAEQQNGESVRELSPGQGQTQGQGQLQGQGQTQGQGQLQGQGQTQTSSSNNANNAAQAVTVQGSTTTNTTTLQAMARNPVATAYAPAYLPSAVCALGVSGGAQGVAFGLSFGASYVDKNCEVLEQVRRAAELGMKDVAAEMMMELPAFAAAAKRVKSATP